MKRVKFFLLMMFLTVLGATSWASDMPTDISLYSNDGISKTTQSNNYNLDISISYLAWKEHSRVSFSTICNTFVVSPSGKEYWFKSFDEYAGLGDSCVVSNNGFIFFDLQAVESGIWKLKAVQIDAGDWFYYDCVADMDDFLFSFEDSTAKVRGLRRKRQLYLGELVIPGTITKDGNTYKVTSIGNSAFDGCSGFTSVMIPKSVTSIGDYAFRNCSGFTSVNIPKGVTSIGRQAFFRCSGFPSVTIPSSVTSIGSDAFEYCDSLTAVHIDDLAAWCNISFMNAWSNPLGCAHHLFMKGEKITELVIPDGMTRIGDFAFFHGYDLTSVTIPDGVTSIGAHAFSDCVGLPSVTIPDGVTSIGYGAFHMCFGLSSVTIPSSVTSIGSDAFMECRKLRAVHIDDLTAWCNISFGSERANPLNYGSHLFVNGQEITELIIPDGVTSIGDNVFCGNRFTSVTIPSSVTGIGKSAFYELDGTNVLTAVHIDDLTAWCNISFGNKYANPLCYANHLFVNGQEITELIIPDGVTSIGNSAFVGGRFTSVTIPDGVTSIGDYAFASCSRLPSITIPGSVTSIGNYAFEFCNGLTSMTIPDGVTSIGDYAFNWCGGLRSVSIPSSVTSIGKNAFHMCSNIRSLALNCKTIDNWFGDINDEVSLVTIGDSVKSIADGAFKGFTWLKKVVVPNIRAWCDISFANANANPLYFAKHLYSDENTEVTDLVLSKGITSVKPYAFYGCEGLTSVVIPSTMTSIGDYAFSCGIALKSVTSMVKDPFLLNESAFSYKGTNYSEDILYQSATLHVPSGCKGIYGSVDGWKKFAKVVEDESFTYKLTYMVDGKEYKSMDVELAEVITPEAEPTKEGFIFSGWSNLPTVMPAHDVIVIGSFTAETTGITEVRQYMDFSEKIVYTVDGKKHQQKQRGMNIVRMSDGTVRKVFVK